MSPLRGTPMAQHATHTRWRAPLADGVAHLYKPHGNGPALCGAPNQDERHDYARGTRCPRCVKAAEA